MVRARDCVAAASATRAEFDDLSTRIPSLVGATQNAALWAFSLGARPGPYFDHAFGRLCDWARGSEAELCQSMMVVSWRGSPGLTSLSELLARRLDSAEPEPLRRAPADTLYLAVTSRSSKASAVASTDPCSHRATTTGIALKRSAVLKDAIAALWSSAVEEQLAALSTLASLAIDMVDLRSAHATLPRLPDQRLGGVLASHLARAE